MSQPSQWERAQMEMRDKAMAAVRQAFDRPERHGGKQEFKILQAIRALPLSPPPGEEEPMDRLSRMNAEVQGRAGLPLGHEFEACTADGECDWFEGFTNACHNGMILGPSVCGQPRSAHVAAPPEDRAEPEHFADFHDIGNGYMCDCSKPSRHSRLAAPPPQAPSEEERSSRLPLPPPPAKGETSK
jgi:hypothetical protein